MSELREVFEMVTKQTEPDVDAWKDQERRQRKAHRNKKIGAIAVVALLVVTAVALGISALRSDDVQPAGSGANPTPAPEGAEQQTMSIVDVGSGSATACITRPSGSSPRVAAISLHGRPKADRRGPTRRVKSPACGVSYSSSSRSSCLIASSQWPSRTCRSDIRYMESICCWLAPSYPGVLAGVAATLNPYSRPWRRSNFPIL